MWGIFRIASAEKTASFFASMACRLGRNLSTGPEASLVDRTRRRGGVVPALRWYPQLRRPGEDLEGRKYRGLMGSVPIGNWRYASIGEHPRAQGSLSTKGQASRVAHVRR